MFVKTKKKCKRPWCSCLGLRFILSFNATVNEKGLIMIIEGCQ